MDTPTSGSIELLAYCGLYCGECRKYHQGKCPGCAKNEKATWCGIRKCCIEKHYNTCAKCDLAVKNCKIYNNFIAKLIGFIFRSDRPACIDLIKEWGDQEFADYCIKNKLMTIKKGKRPTTKEG